MIAETSIPVLSLRAVPASIAAPYAKVEVFTAAEPALDVWAELEAGVPCSVYQTRAWLLPWLDTLGRKAGLDPLFAVARKADGTPVALLCLGVRKQGPIRVATFLGGKDSNFNFPLMRSPEAWTPTALRRLLVDVASTMGRAAPHVFILANQPVAWAGTANPFASLPHQASPSAAFGTRLPADAEALFAAKLSKDTRKKLRKKEAKLAGLGPLTHRVASTDSERDRILEAFVSQKVARFRDKGIRSEFDTPEMRAFIETASAPDGRGIELHALLAGNRIVATYGGAAHDGQWSGMFNSFDADEEIAKSSPGDLLLMRVMAKACTDGLTRFDLGIGEARYKAALCDDAIPLIDVVVPIGIAGRLYGTYAEARQRAKRFVKTDPRLMALVAKFRARRPVR